MIQRSSRKVFFDLTFTTVFCIQKMIVRSKESCSIYSKKGSLERMRQASASSIDPVVALTKRRGFIFPSSEIYGGLGSCYDYGPLGALLKRNVKDAWWRAMVHDREDIVGLDSAILMHPMVWKSSGHVDGFSDPMIDCKTCKKRFRADDMDGAICGQKPSKSPMNCGASDLTEPRNFNLMFETFLGPISDSSAKTFLRPETAQGIFANFAKVRRELVRKDMSALCKEDPNYLGRFMHPKFKVPSELQDIAKEVAMRDPEVRKRFAMSAYAPDPETWRTT